MERIPLSKSSRVREECLKGKVHCSKLAVELGINRKTVARYIKEFNEIRQLYPNQVKNVSFRLPPKKRERTQLYHDLMVLLPVLIDRAITPCLMVTHLWADYRSVYPHGYGLFWFGAHYNIWRNEHQICRYSHRRVRSISPGEEKILLIWRNAGSRERWQKATVILGSFANRPLSEMMAQVEKTRDTLLIWIDHFKTGSIALLDKQHYTTSPDLLELVRVKQENLTKLLHQTPQLHGFNRASWRVADLCVAYQQVYQLPISRSCALENLHKMGLGYYKSRELLTSPDPDFRPKLDHIKQILTHLGERERFFSVDEYGPFAIKMKIGRSFTPAGQIKTVAQAQKSKGFIIVTAALELAHNQVSHIYSYKKNTDEIIKLIDVLLIEYRDTDKLYLSWDAASWHASKKLDGHLVHINSEGYRLEHGTPRVELAPLPVSAQFLNVIESVFSGLAKAVIHNSDYQSVDECRKAIDCHFHARNAHYKKHPLKAGKKIWGSEIVVPEFNEGKHAKSLTGMRGARA
ncbi:IS630 family transposase [Mucilaginibacter lutimaris]|uniref:IS630 family transposase n=1 Tax=Mucilaginibacter lutimaris TaxID=931629 RepID=A0ABW2ZGX9_9SPHI